MPNLKLDEQRNRMETAEAIENATALADKGDREGGKAPSLAQTDMKPKDCKLFQDIKQKMFFRFHVFHAQGLNATNAQVTCRGFRV